MSLSIRVQKKRASLTSLPLYHSGLLHMKRSKEKEFKDYYAELCGVTLFLYKDNSQEKYIEKLDLEQLKSMKLDSPYKKTKPTIFTLTLPTEKVQLKMDSADTGEEWKGYILTVANKEIPSKLQLLPGQMLKLEDTLAQERRRNVPGSPPPLPSKPAFMQRSVSGDTCSSATEDKSASGMPECFFKVTRQEAEKMLEENPENGGIIIRPSTMANNYAITLRQLTPRGPVMKNFRVTSVNSGFVIELEKTVTVPTLNDVLKYFLKKTEYRLCPYASQPYATRIEVDPEPTPVGINSPADKKTVPKAQVAPSLQSMSKPEIPPPPEKPEDGDDVNPDDHNPKLEVDPEPTPVGINSPADKKTVPEAQVAPSLQSMSKPEIQPPPEKPADGDNVNPDDHNPKLEVDPEPTPVGINSPADKKTVPEAQVAPSLQSMSKPEIQPPPEKPAEGDDVNPDDHNPKQDQLDDEVRTVDGVKEQQRQQLDDSSVDKDGHTKKIDTNSPSSTVSCTNTTGDSKD